MRRLLIFFFIWLIVNCNIFITSINNYSHKSLLITQFLSFFAFSNFYYYLYFVIYIHRKSIILLSIPLLASIHGIIMLVIVLMVVVMMMVLRRMSWMMAMVVMMNGPWVTWQKSFLQCFDNDTWTSWKVEHHCISCLCYVS